MLNKIFKVIVLISIIFSPFYLAPGKASASVYCNFVMDVDTANKSVAISSLVQSDIGGDFYDIYLNFGEGGGNQFIGKLDGSLNENRGYNTHTYSANGTYRIELTSASTCDQVDFVTFVSPQQTQGCTDSNATNYNPSATVDDGSCTYPYVNLNFVVASGCGAPISGATVSIDRDFGNGTTRTADGSGFANFGVYKNVSIGYTVSATGYSSVSGSVNSGTNGSTVTPSLTSNSGCGGAASGYPDIVISANPTSVYSGNASTISWTVTNATSCTASGDWSGSKSTSGGSQSTGAISSAKAYTLSCSNGTGTTVKTANVGIIAGSCSNPPTSAVSGAYTIVTYTCNGIFNPPTGVSSVDYLLVGGGGGGGNGTNRGGGGGGGNVTGAQNAAVSSATTYTVTVGAGGAAQSDGGSSSFSSFTVAGGSGGGGGESGGSPNGRGGTIGGGGGSWDGGAGAGAGGVGSVHNGGGGAGNAGGGGGGAGANGGPAGGFNQAGNGGAGRNIAYIDGNTYGGGGGGASIEAAPKSGSGGAGGGGAGGGGLAGVAGTPNTGGGGGGTSQGWGNGAAGAAGIVKIKYLTPVTVNGSCGTANKAYAAGATTYGSDTFCSTGTPAPTSPTFPTAGNSTSWSCLGSMSGTNSSCVATRGASGYSVTVSKTTGGEVKSSDNNINCGTTCSSSYSQNSTVTLQAYPASSYWKFSGWSGDCTGTGLCVLIINGAKAVTASFSLRSFNYMEF